MVVEVKEALIVVMVLLHLMVVVIGVLDICALCSAWFNALARGLRPLHLESYLTARSLQVQ